MTIIPYSNVGNLYPDLLRQILDGVSEHNYELKSGRIKVTYLEKDGIIERKMMSSGSLDVAMTSSSVSNFFQEFPLQDYYNIKNPRVKDCLEHAFRLIIKREKETTLVLSDDTQITVSFERKVVDPLGLRGGEIPAEDWELLEKIESFIRIPCLSNFTYDRMLYLE